MAILRGTSTNKTAKSGSLAKVMRPKASPAKSNATGRRRCGISSLMPVAISRPAAVAAMPRDDEKAGNCGDHSDHALHLCSDAHGNSDDVRPGHELAKAYNVGKFAVGEPAMLLDGNAARPDNPAAADTI